MIVEVRSILLSVFGTSGAALIPSGGLCLCPHTISWAVPLSSYHLVLCQAMSGPHAAWRQATAAATAKALVDLLDASLVDMENCLALVLALPILRLTEVRAPSADMVTHACIHVHVEDLPPHTRTRTYTTHTHAHTHTRTHTLTHTTHAHTHTLRRSPRLTLPYLSSHAFRATCIRSNSRTSG